jgi:hypothetical protein
MKTVAKELEDLARDSKVRQAVRALIKGEETSSGAGSGILIALTDEDSEPIIIRRANTP